MALAVRDERRQVCILGTRVIPPHGDGGSPTLSPDPIGETTTGSTTDVYGRVLNRGGSLVFAVRREDEAYAVLMLIAKEQDYKDTRPILNGKIQDSSNPDPLAVYGWTWKDAYLTEYPEFSLGRSPDLINFTFRVSGLVPL